MALHLTHCSPCFEEHEKYVKEYEQHEQKVHLNDRRRSFARIAALLLVSIGLGVGGWHWIKRDPRPNSLAGPTQDAVPSKEASREVAQVKASLPVAYRSVDLRLDKLEVRAGSEARGVSSLTLPRGVLQVNIRLPVGAEAGNYQIRLSTLGKTPLINAESKAQIGSRGIAILQAELDTSKISVGEYYLGIRLDPWDWTNFLIKVK